jgi:hypothetical protein
VRSLMLAEVLLTQPPPDVLTVNATSTRPCAAAGSCWPPAAVPSRLARRAATATGSTSPPSLGPQARLRLSAPTPTSPGRLKSLPTRAPMKSAAPWRAGAEPSAGRQRAQHQIGRPWLPVTRRRSLPDRARSGLVSRVRERVGPRRQGWVRKYRHVPAGVARRQSAVAGS